MKDGGGPPGIGFQEQVPNQSELRRLKAVVVNVGSKVPVALGAGRYPKAERKQTLEDASITIRVVKTRGGPQFWDQSVGRLMTGRTATGVQGADGSIVFRFKRHVQAVSHFSFVISQRRPDGSRMSRT